MDEATKTTDGDAAESDDRRREREFSRLDRFKFAAGALLASSVIHVLGRTLRWEVRGFTEYEDDPETANRFPIFAFWHGEILASTYFWRNRGIAVMTSMNRDGEYIARVIEHFGFTAARGSSSRGGRRALVEMLRLLKNCKGAVAFTVDCPRGPRHVAKPGAVWLAARLGHAILPFNIALEKKWVLSSWDRFEIPKPFSKAYVEAGPLIRPERDASEEQLNQVHLTLQRTLDGLRERGESHWQKNQGLGARD